MLSNGKLHTWFFENKKPRTTSSWKKRITEAAIVAYSNLKHGQPFHFMPTSILLDCSFKETVVSD